MTRRIFLFALAACLAGALAWSNPQDDSYTRIARLSHLEGHVSFQHGSDVDWSVASINLPIEPGDRIYTGTDGRAEIEFDDGSALRMAENTDIEFLALKQNLVQMRMLLGLSTLTVYRDLDFEIDTPAAAFNTLREGVYRFDVVESGNTDAIVRKGELEAASNEFLKRLRAGELLHISPGGRNPEMSLYDRRDEWDEWNDRRNADIRVYGNQRYLPDQVYIGASDLYRHGRWMNVDTYGTVWVPSGVDAAWAPYSVGRWCYRPFYGWTWVSYEPWGWLPYHYGRWYRNSLYGWCWIPGPAFSFNFWSPGLVSFYRGSGWVSWCPLGPGDYYDIGNYHYNHRIHGLRLADMQRLHNRGVGDPFNRHVPGAFRTAQLERFRDGSFDNSSRNTRLNNIDRPWSQGTPVRDRLDIQPSTRSFGAVPDRVAVRPGVGASQSVVVRNAPDRDSDNRERFTRITNPQIPSIPSRSARAREEVGSRNNGISQPNGRSIQTPDARSEGGPANNESRRTEGPRWSGRTNDAPGVRDGSARATPESTAPANRQNPTRQRIERTIPEQRTTPQRTPEVAPRNESRPQSNYSERWNNSAPGASRSPEPGEARVYRSPETRSAPAYSAPRSESGERSGNAGTQVLRAPGPGRSPSYSAPAPRPSSPSNSGGRNYSSPSPSSGKSEGHSRNSSEGKPERHR
jgi:hypothetical protein